jgi:ABC-2 type transport system permease protein
VAEVIRLADLYRRLVGAQLRSQLQYRASFALDAIGMFAVSFLDFIAILILFENVPALAGWSVAEVAFLYATSGLAFAFADLFVGHVEHVSRLIREGTFDILLIRPRGTLFQLVASDFQLRRLGKAAQSLAVLAYALPSLDVDWTAGRLAMLGVMEVAALVIFVSVWVFMNVIVFWTVEGGEFANAFTYGGNALTQYPINLYGAWLRRFLAYAIPMAFVAYYPALYILDKPDPLGLPTAFQFISPAVAAAAAAVAGVTWRFAVRHYGSAGG